MRRYSIWLACLLLLSGCGREADNRYQDVTIAADAPTDVIPAAVTPTDVALESTDAPADRETVDERCYELITDIPAAEVEQFALQVKQQFMTRDWNALSENLAYPVTIDGAAYRSGEEFLAADFEEKLNPYFFVEIKEESCNYMSSNQDGIMLGQTGRVWISEILNEDLSSQGLKVIAINGLTESFGLPGGVRITAAVDGVSADSLKLILENETDLNMIFGDDFKLRKYPETEDTWEELKPLADDMAFHDIGYMPRRGQPVEWTADIGSLYGTLEDGRYAIVKTVVDEDAPKGSGRFECAFEFRIAAPSGKN